MNLSDVVERKFIEVIDCSSLGIEVMTDTGYQPIISTNKTIEYDVYELVLDNGMMLECADTHIVFDNNMNERFVVDLAPNDIIITELGESRVVSVNRLDRSENMYDLSVDSDDHRYYTGGVLSHNTTTLGLIALHAIVFNPDYAVGITSFTVANVKDFLSRIKYSYENLPDWIKPPVKTYNTTTVEFTNNSIVYGQVTSENALRGRTNNMVIVDEFAFAPPAIADEFYTAILPSLTADGEESTTKAIFISTPNGTTGKFFEIWVGAVDGGNGFVQHEVDHTKIPGRTPKFVEGMIAKLGINKYKQEYENKWLSSSSTLVDSQVIENIITKPPVSESLGLRMFVDSVAGRTLVASLDPSEGVGSDNHVIQIFDVNTLEQVGIYANNTDNQHMLTKKLIDLITMFFNQGATEIYYGIENNGVGNGVLRLIEAADNSYLDRATMISSTDANGVIRKSGITMTSRSKAIGCAQLKQMMENLQISINDAMTKTELQMFVKTGNSFAAQRGAKDDRVMSLVILMLILLELTVYEDSVEEAVNDVGNDDDESWGFSF